MTRRSRRYCLFLLWLFLCGSVLAAKRQDDPFVSTIDRVKNSVVPVLCGSFDAAGQFSIQQIEGTGFFVDDGGHFLTAAHVIHDLGVVAPGQPLPCARAIYIPNGGWQREAVTAHMAWFAFDHCDIDDTLDLAVCKTVSLPPASVRVNFLDARPPDGTQVAFSGFPLRSAQPISSRCDIATYQRVIDTEGSRDLILDKGNWPGASGSPIYDENGLVVGILLMRGTADGEGITVGRPSHFIIQFLRKNGITVGGGDSRANKAKK